jgi:malate/lactate dehydrogenase
MENQALTSTLRRLRTIRNHIDKATAQNAKDPFRVLITGAGGNIGYALAFMVGQGRMFGPSQPVILHLFDLPAVENVLKGIAMEIMDCAFDLVKGIVFSSDPAVAFKDIDFAVFCGAKPRGPGMERKDLLSANAKIFQEQGKYIENYARKSVKVRDSIM